MAKNASAGSTTPSGAGVPEATSARPTPIWPVRVWLRFLGLGHANARDPRLVVAKANPTDAQVRYADMVAKQIEVEQGLPNTRMMWNLTFQGFTIAGYALVAASGGSNPARWVLQSMIALTSITIAYATLRGVVASQVQRQYLKDCWDTNGLTAYFPVPFSITRTSLWGRFPAYIICLMLIVMWLTLLAAQAAQWVDEDKSVKVKVEGRPQIELPGNVPSPRK